MLSKFTTETVKDIEPAMQFPNIDNLDFSEIEDMKPVQEFTIPQGRDVGEYHVMYVHLGDGFVHSTLI